MRLTTQEILAKIDVIKKQLQNLREAGCSVTTLQDALMDLKVLIALREGDIKNLKREVV